MGPTLIRITTLVVKEFLAIMKDPKSRIVVIGPPIISSSSSDTPPRST